jgi:hypothetical protein
MALGSRCWPSGVWAWSCGDGAGGRFWGLYYRMKYIDADRIPGWSTIYYNYRRGEESEEAKAILARRRCNSKLSPRFARSLLSL